MYSPPQSTSDLSAWLQDIIHVHPSSSGGDSLESRIADLRRDYTVLANLDNRWVRALQVHFIPAVHGTEEYAFVFETAHEFFDGIGVYEVGDEFCRHLATALTADSEPEGYTWGNEVARLGLAMPMRTKEAWTEISESEKQWVDGVFKQLEDSSVSLH